jgi:thiamine biosynthesis lipoprotein
MLHGIRMLTVWSWCLLVILFIATSCTKKPSRRAVTFRTQTMGTWASLTLVTDDSSAVADLAYEALLVLHEVDSLMSNWTDVSEVARINRLASHDEVRAHPAVGEVLTIAQRIGDQSDGAFDITVEPLVRLWGFLGGQPSVPDQEAIDQTLAIVGWDRLTFDSTTLVIRFASTGVKIDLGGIAKGYGVDRVADLLREAEVSNALIDLSGNMVALGNAAVRQGWSVGIRDPLDEHNYLARLRLLDEAIATSGDYEQFVSQDGQRFGHILDPRTGWPTRGLTSVTVAAASATVADAWATALFVMGLEKARQVAQERDDLAVILLEAAAEGDRGALWIEEGLRDRCRVKPELSDELVVRFF